MLIPEGLRTDEIVKLLAAKTKIPVAQLQAVAGRPGRARAARLRGRQPRGLPVPGDVRRGARRGRARRCSRRWCTGSPRPRRTPASTTRAADVHLTPYQVLVVASIVQAEGRTEDFPKIARAIMNRLDAGMRLQLNSTVNYVARRTTKAAAVHRRHRHPVAVQHLPARRAAAGADRLAGRGRHQRGARTEPRATGSTG